ncbi:MAG TPA: hypothetical protein VFI96_09320 [Longimicrobiaceae bacterium]|nr:hypothetical protein [Longimicrobiaceae bacterium]
MIALPLALALLQTAAAATADTVPAYDGPATREVVERTIQTSGEVPEGLHDYRARVQSSLYTIISTDSAGAGDLPASVDETVSLVHWNRSGALHQEVIGHRARLLVPVPYTLASILETPWVVPVLYGSELYTPFAGPRAVNPFGRRGPEFYRYRSGDTIRITVQGETVTLLPVEVRPRVDPSETDRVLVVGTFYLDVQRAAVARARFGFVSAEGVLPPSVGRLDTYLELENALWQGRYWLPYQQRREVMIDSRVLGGAVAARVVNRVVSLEINTGWEPIGKPVQLVWKLQPEKDPFADWRSDVGAEAGKYSTSDFADLRIATEAAAAPPGGGPRLELHYERGSDLFRYDRVEGLYLGLGARLLPSDPRRERWQLYGTAGWAFAEGTARGELQASWGEAVAPAPGDGADFGAEAAVYRRLEDLIAFRPTYGWDWIYSLPALLWGSDTRDYYDATGAELFGTVRRGRWSARVGGRVEQEDSVSVNTHRFAFGEAEGFGPLAGIYPGTLTALEGSAGYSLGPGAFGIGNSLVARLDARLAAGDFHYQRLSGLLSVRYGLGPVTLATRVDGGQVWGVAPPQALFRFGSTQGLRGYEPNEFGGSTALLARSRLTVGIPPRSQRPIARVGFLLIPPLRPSLVFLAESGWTWIRSDLRDELDLLRAEPTDGARSSLGLGLSFFDDAFTIEHLWPVGPDAEDRSGKWYAGLTVWY